MGVSSWLQGGPVRLKKANVCLMFQANCPACFESALPALADLHSRFADCDDVAVFAVGTAFEDFELNTESSTRALLADGTVGGAALQYLRDAQGKERYDRPLPFPVGWDRVEPTPSDAAAVRQKADALLDTLVGTGRVRGDSEKCAPQREALRRQFEQLIASRPYAPEMFDANMLRGTPSWFIFKEDGSLCNEWLGAQPVASIEAIVRRIVDQP